MGKVRADTLALDFAIKESLEKWSGVSPDNLPDKIRKYYKLRDNTINLKHLTLEEKMLFWNKIHPNNRVFVYFSEDGKTIQEKDVKYFDEVPIDYSIEKESEINITISYIMNTCYLLLWNISP